MWRFLKKVTGMEVMSSEDVMDLVKRCDIVREQIKKPTGNEVVDIDRVNVDFAKLKTEIGIEGETLDRETWEKKSSVKKVELFEKLLNFHHLFRTLNRNNILSGRIVIFLAALLFILTVSLYLYLHFQTSTTFLTHGMGGQAVSAEVAPGDAMKDRFTKLLGVGGWRMSDSFYLELSKQVMTLEVLGSANPVDSQKLKEAFKVFKTTLIPMMPQLPTEIVSQIGVVEAEIDSDAVDKVSITRLGKMLNAAITNLRIDFFWTNTMGKWLEISFWSICGTLVGILFYVAGLLSTGVFYPSQIPMMIVEVLITPVVVLVIFSVFPMTDITEMNPSENSIHWTLGVAFVFGFAIRRTVGLIDNIKRRLFPDPPQEGSKSST